jgi:hypothetical protein
MAPQSGATDRLTVVLGNQSRFGDPQAIFGTAVRRHRAGASATSWRRLSLSGRRRSRSEHTDPSPDLAR